MYVLEGCGLIGMKRTAMLLHGVAPARVASWHSVVSARVRGRATVGLRRALLTLPPGVLRVAVVQHPFVARPLERPAHHLGVAHGVQHGQAPVDHLVVVGRALGEHTRLRPGRRQWDAQALAHVLPELLRPGRAVPEVLVVVHLGPSRLLALPLQQSEGALHGPAHVLLHLDVPPNGAGHQPGPHAAEPVHLRLRGGMRHVAAPSAPIQHVGRLGDEPPQHVPAPHENNCHVLPARRAGERLEARRGGVPPSRRPLAHGHLGAVRHHELVAHALAVVALRAARKGRVPLPERPGAPSHGGLALGRRLRGVDGRAAAAARAEHLPGLESHVA
mmetsp:Transcript_21370/g.71896  ORF Transcript_21370/g.71896 Transcript_21370/m.71896 type:complete len:331 (-) Transcript_21370:203-1195(-)